MMTGAANIILNTCIDLYMILDIHIYVRIFGFVLPRGQACIILYIPIYTYNVYIYDEGAANIILRTCIDLYMILYSFARMHTYDSGYTYIRVHLMTGAAGWTGGAHGFVGECDARFARCLCVLS